jgi:hypothetical protein
MGNEDYRAASGTEGGDMAQKLVRDPRIQRGRRLIEDNQPGVAPARGKPDGDFDHLALGDG